MRGEEERARGGGCPLILMLTFSTVEHSLVAVEIILAVEIIVAVDNEKIIVTEECMSCG